MTTHYDVSLTINMPDGGRHARKLLNIYHTDLPVDINQVAYDLCDANEAVRARRFGKATLKRSEVWSDQPGILTLFGLLSVFSDDPDFIKKVIAKYMEGLAGYLRQASDQYYGADSFPPEISLQHTGWSVEVNRNPHG